MVFKYLVTGSFCMVICILGGLRISSKMPFNIAAVEKLRKKIKGRSFIQMNEKVIKIIGHPDFE